MPAQVGGAGGARHHPAMTALRRLVSGALDLALPGVVLGLRPRGPPAVRDVPAGARRAARACRPGRRSACPADIPAPLLQLEWCAPYAGPVRAALHDLKYARRAAARGAARRGRRATLGDGSASGPTSWSRSPSTPSVSAGAATTRRRSSPRRGADARPAVRPGAGAPARDGRPVRARARRACHERRRRVRRRRAGDGAGRRRPLGPARRRRRHDRRDARRLRRGARPGRAPRPSRRSRSPGSADRSAGRSGGSADLAAYTRGRTNRDPSASIDRSPEARADAQGGSVRTIVKGKNAEIPDRVRDYAERKLKRIERLLDDQTDATVELWNEQHRSAAASHIAEVSLVIHGQRPAQPRDRLELPGGARRRRGQGRAPGRRPQGEAPPARPARGGEADPPAAGRRQRAVRRARSAIVKVKRFAIEPMFEEDAVGAMEDLGHQFFVFVNAETERVADPLPPQRRRLRPDRAVDRRRVHEGPRSRLESPEPARAVDTDRSRRRAGDHRPMGSRPGASYHAADASRWTTPRRPPAACDRAGQGRRPGARDRGERAPDLGRQPDDLAAPRRARRPTRPRSGHVSRSSTSGRSPSTPRTW